jgi:histone H1/5
MSCWFLRLGCILAGVKNKSLKQSKGTGASGSFKIGEVVKPKKKLAAKPKKVREK